MGVYSFSPVADLSNTHLGFYSILAITLVIALPMAYHAIKDSCVACFLFTLALAAIVIGIAASDSFNYTAPKNEQVTGKFVGYVAEGFNERSGKTRADHHYTYVVYEVPEGRVMLRTCAGCVYPEYAILYKN